MIEKTLYNWFKIKCVEPVKRKHGSMFPEWISHRFPIKNGISYREAMIYDMAQQRNPFWENMMKDMK